MSEIRKKLLTAFTKEIGESEDIRDASVFTAEELGIEADVVRCAITELGLELIDVLGEFFFYPYEDEEVLYFSSVITIADEYDENAMSDLEAAVSRINAFLPCGAFTTGAEGKNLIYKYTIPVMADMKEKDQLRSMLTAANAAITTADTYMGYLVLVIGGDVTPEEMMEAVLGKTDDGPEPERASE